MVVDLREGHAVRELSLIGPDGRALTEVDVAPGETTSDLEILDIRSGLGGYDHYEPGEYELVAASGEDTVTLDVELVPELRITDVRQYRDGDRNEDYGKLAVTVENVGTAPTWVYAITTQGAPNYTANDPLINDPGVPRIAIPENPEDQILIPGQHQTYVGRGVPFLFTDNSRQECDGGYDLTVLVGIADGSDLGQDLSATITGEVHSVGLSGEFTCDDIGVQVISTGGTDV